MRGVDELQRRHLERTLAGAEAALERFGTVTHRKSRWRIAATLCTKGVTLVQLGRYAEGLAVCDEVLARYGAAGEAPMRALVAGALRHRRAALAGLGRTEDELAACDEAVARFEDDPDPVLRAEAASALVDRGDLLARLGQEPAACAAWRRAWAYRGGTAGTDEVPDDIALIRHRARQRLAGVPVTLRPGVSADAEAVGALILEAYQEFRALVTEQFWEGFAADAVDRGRRPDTSELVVAEQAGTLLGTATYYAADGSYGGPPWPPDCSGIRLLAVSPQGRGLGVGRLLASWCVGRARELGSAAIGLHTAPFMTAAQGIYEGLGFERVPELDIVLDGGPQALAYRLALT